MTIRDTSSRLMRWCLKLDDYNYEIIFRPGKMNVVADALSRPRLDVDYLSIDSIDAKNSATMLVVTRSKTKQLATLNTPTIEPTIPTIKELVIINANVGIITTNVLF